jgi:hypothetical protein
MSTSPLPCIQTPAATLAAAFINVDSMWGQVFADAGDYLQIADAANSKTPSDPYYPTQK